MSLAAVSIRIRRNQKHATRFVLMHWKYDVTSTALINDSIVQTLLVKIPHPQAVTWNSSLLVFTLA